MKLLVITCIFIIGGSASQVKTPANNNSSTENKDQIPKPTTSIQKRGDFGYSHSEGKLNDNLHFLRFANKQLSQINKPYNRYGPPIVSKNPPFNTVPPKHSDSTETSPIASQNNHPFTYHTANYLPPQNQKLPTYTSGYKFTEISNQKILDTAREPEQISDASLFLFQNAPALQQLYNAPGLDQNYAPNEFQLSDNVQQDEINSQQALHRIQSLEKDQLIAQLQRVLALRSQSLTNEVNNLEHSSQSIQHQRPELTFFPHKTTLTTSYGVPLTSTLSPPVISQPSGNTNFNCDPQLNPPVSFDTGPQKPSTPIGGIYNGFIPSFVPATNVFPNLLNYPAIFGTSPTHFNVPIPTLPETKPVSEVTPTSDSTTPSPINPQNPFVYPLRPILPITPGQELPNQPNYGVQTPLIHPFLLKPMKPVQPVYYYPNIILQLQKSQTHPWNYAPSYQTQTQPDQGWK